MNLSLHEKNDLELSFAIVPTTGQRLNRLIHMAASCREVVNQILDDIQKSSVVGIQTAILTKHPEAKEMRGIMKMKSRAADPHCGLKLTYRCDIREESLEQIKMEWLRKEESWLKNRA